MRQRMKEWLSIQVAKRPRRMVLGIILLFNIVFLLFSAIIISNFSVSGTEEMNFFEAAFCTLTMILDPGCIQFVIADIGRSGVTIAIICLIVVIVGMISFTGAVIGYTTNTIAEFIGHSDEGVHKLHISDHVVILNWNTRASEIINDLLYCNTKQKVVVLVNSRKNEIEKEISERLADTVATENERIRAYCAEKGFLDRCVYEWRHRFKKNVMFVVREGDVFSSRQLKDLSIEKAKTVIILGNDVNNTVCEFEYQERLKQMEKGNSLTIKTLMQVADMTAAESSADDQKIIVEITDNWTLEVVEKIIKCKQVDGKCNIVPVRINQVLGQILSQFSLMPELNLAYRELFSNKGATFYVESQEEKEEETYIEEYLKEHKHAIPLTVMQHGKHSNYYFVASAQKYIHKTSQTSHSDYTVKLNRNYWIEQKNVVILGHNSNCEEIMKGFSGFRAEWHYTDKAEEIVRIVVIDNEENLKEMNYYKDYPFVIKTVAAEIYDKDLICATINEFVSEHEEDTSILILSDDSSLNENIDANALANLVYVQDIINTKKEENPEFSPESIDVIVEIIDPKHHDIVNSYGVNNVVISNRYISKMITQIGEKEELYDFYNDILTYDDDDGSGKHESKEIYVKKVSRFFDEIPGPCTAEEFIRALYYASVDPALPREQHNPTIVLGYIKPGQEMVLFGGNQSSIKVELGEKDKLILFSNH